MELNELMCRRCQAPLATNDFNWELGLATCAHCNTVFSIEGRPGAALRSPATWQRPPVPIPAKFEITHPSNGLSISYRWFRLSFVFLAVFSVFWNGFMLVWHGISLASGALFMSAFGLIHTAVGIGIGYYTIAGFLNHTKIAVERDVLHVRHGPMPWFGNLDLLVGDLEQLYAKQVVKQNQNGSSTSYEVHAILRNGRQQKLISGLDEPEQALYLEQEIERYLGIEDRPVPSELPR